VLFFSFSAFSRGKTRQNKKAKNAEESLNDGDFSGLEEKYKPVTWAMLVSNQRPLRCERRIPKKLFFAAFMLKHAQNTRLILVI